MVNNQRLNNYILSNNYTEDNMNDLLTDLSVTKKQLIAKSFKILNSYLSDIKDNYYYISMISSIIYFISFLCSTEEMNPEEVKVNKLRIKKSRETLLIYLKKNKNDELLRAANELDEIILDKNIDTTSLIDLIKKLIDNKEDVDIIKKFINTNKASILKTENGLFDYVFDKCMISLIRKNCDIYYYITLLKIMYNSKIDTRQYLAKLDKCTTISDIFTHEIYEIIHGNRRALNTNQILYDKYGLIRDFSSVGYIKNNSCGNMFTGSPIITIDGNRTYLRDDGLSVRRDGPNYIVGIHIADAGRCIVKNSSVDNVAFNNFKCLYFKGGKKTRMLSPSIENDLSFNQDMQRPAITLYVILNDSGDLIDYYLEKNDIVIGKNFTFSESDDVINYVSYTEFSKDMNNLYLLAYALENKNKGAEDYWDKKHTNRANNLLDSTKGDVIVRQFMILYNEILSKIMKEEKIPYIYRVQDKEYITDLVTAMEIPIDDYTSKILKSVFLESKYSATPSYHAGLGVDCYSHSCNPLRRYTDLYNQYLLHKFYFKDVDFDYSEQELLDFINYANQRSMEYSLLKSEYTREAKLIKK